MASNAEITGSVQNAELYQARATITADATPAMEKRYDVNNFGHPTEAKKSRDQCRSKATKATMNEQQVSDVKGAPLVY